MIKSFRNEATRRLYDERTGRGFRGLDLPLALNRLIFLNNVASLADVPKLRTFNLHALSADRKGQWAISINARWRLCFEFRDGNAYSVEVVDYHKG